MARNNSSKVTTSLLGVQVRLTMGRPVDWMEEQGASDVVLAARRKEASAEAKAKAMSHCWHHFWEVGQIVAVWASDGELHATVQFPGGALVDCKAVNLAVTGAA